MADVGSTLVSWSSSDASNLPSGSTSIGTGLDDNLRALQGVVVRGLSHKGSDIASASPTTDIGAIEGLMHDITGSTAITSLGTVRAGILKVLKFEGALTFTHNATSLILPGAANITTADGDVAVVISEGSGNWRCLGYQRANGRNVIGTVLDTVFRILDDGDTTKQVAFQASGITTATTRTLTVPDHDLTIGDAPVSGTVQATTSGTEKDFTIPTWAKKIIVTFVGVSTDGTSALLIQIGDAGGIETSGYSSSASAGTTDASSTAGFLVTQAFVAAGTAHGSVHLTLHEAASFTWVANGNVAHNGSSITSAGSKALSAALTTVRVTSVTPNTFDAGAVNVVYQ
jgi:hypothetical protein